MARIKSDATKIAFNTVKNRINNFDLLPGDTVSDLNLSKELSMSRTPIREAIMLLIQYNLVKKTKNKYIVTEIEKKDIKELLAVRIALETLAAKLIVKNGGLTLEQLTKIEKIENSYLSTLKEKNYIENFKYDALFHKTIVSFANNGRLSEVMRNISIQSERLRWLSILTPVRFEKAESEHSEIIEYLKEKNIDKVCSKMTSHLELSLENYNRVTENGNIELIVTSFKKAFLLR